MASWRCRVTHCVSKTYLTRTYTLKAMCVDMVMILVAWSNMKQQGTMRSSDPVQTTRKYFVARIVCHIFLPRVRACHVSWRMKFWGIWDISKLRPIVLIIAAISTVGHAMVFCNTCYLNKISREWEGILHLADFVFCIHQMIIVPANIRQWVWYRVSLVLREKYRRTIYRPLTASPPKYLLDRYVNT